MKQTIAHEPAHEQKLVSNEARTYFVNDEFFFLRHQRPTDDEWLHLHQPYRIGSPRLINIERGEGHYIINLQEHTAQAGDLFYLPAGAIMQCDGMTDDYSISVVYLGRQRQTEGSALPLQLHLSESQQTLVSQYFDLTASILAAEGYQPSVIDRLLSSFFFLVTRYREEAISQSDSMLSRQAVLFQQFLSLVNRHAAQGARTIQFYADRLCTAPHHLCAVVKEASGQTIMQWVERAVVSEAKVELRYTDRPVSDIAHQLHFDDASTFTRYFRRVTGMTPSEYREK